MSLKVATRRALLVLEVVEPVEGGGDDFVGAYDDFESNIKHAYGFRRLLSSYTGSLIRLREDSGDTESDFGADDEGDLDVAAISSWLSGADGYLVKIYDQKGSADLGVTGDSNEPFYVASIQNGLPGAEFDATDDVMFTGTFTSVAQPVEHLMVAAPTGSRGEFFHQGTGTGHVFVKYLSSGYYTLYAGSVLSNTTGMGSSWHVYQVLFDGSSSEVWEDGTSKLSGNAGTQGVNKLFINANSTPSPHADSVLGMDFAEYVMFDDDMASDRASIRSAADDYWAV